MKIYTKTGDSGQTAFFGGERVSKSNIRIDAYGTIDELNCYIGLALTEVSAPDIRKVLERIQNQLFVTGSDLATPDNEKNKKLNITRTPESFIKQAEADIDFFNDQLDDLKNFILPGGSKSAVYLHICRTVARRAERKVVALNEQVKIGNNIIIFLNRLSDLFFVLSRFENKVSNIPDTKWIP